MQGSSQLKLARRENRIGGQTIHTERTQASDSHRTFHLGLIFRYDLLVLSESRGWHGSSGYGVEPLSVDDFWGGLCSWSPTCNVATRSSVFFSPLFSSDHASVRGGNSNNEAQCYCIPQLYSSSFLITLSQKWQLSSSPVLHSSLWLLSLLPGVLLLLLLKNSKPSAGWGKTHTHTHKRTENYNNNMMKGTRRRLKVSSRKVLVPPVSKISRHAYQERSSHTQFRLTNCAAGKQEFKSLSREPPSHYQPSLLPLPPAPPLSLSRSHTHTFIHDFRGHTLAHITVRKTKTIVLTITYFL